MDYDLIKKNKLGQRSVCDFCGKQLRWFDNIPVLSWVLLKGKSNCCAKKLPISYPLVELLMGILFLINFNLGNNILLYFVLIFLLFSAFFDLKWMILPDFSTVILIILGLFFIKSFSNIYCALGSFGFLYLLYLITKGKGMGFGDVKYAIFMGLFLGWPNILVAFYIAFIFGALVGFVLMLAKIKKFKSEIAFGPFLILGTILAWYFGTYMLNLVYKWI